jgi:hypothetical protein
MDNVEAIGSVPYNQGVIYFPSLRSVFCLLTSHELIFIIWEEISYLHTPVTKRLLNNMKVLELE